MNERSMMEKEMNPQVAILLATYNGEKYLREQLNSLLNQTYRDFLCYIHDDGSKDHTREIIKEYVENYPDTFVEITGKSKGGPKENFLFLLQKVEADLYMFCDQDDVWMNTKIEETLTIMRTLNKEVPACVYTDLYVVDSNLKMICSSFYKYTPLNPRNNSYKQLLLYNVCVGCTMMINKRTRDRMMGFESQYINMHDWVAALLSSMEGSIRFIDHETIYYRQHECNQIGAKTAKRKTPLQKAISAVLNTRKFIDGSREVVETPRKRAKELLSLNNLDPEEKRFFSELAEIENKQKIDRIRFYRENNLFDFQKNKIVQLIFI